MSMYSFDWILKLTIPQLHGGHAVKEKDSHFPRRMRSSVCVRFCIAGMGLLFLNQLTKCIQLQASALQRTLKLKI